MPDPEASTDQESSAALVTDEGTARVQARTVRVLALGQVLGGIAFGATISLGALLARDLTGQDAVSGLAPAPRWRRSRSPGSPLGADAGSR